MFDYGWSGASSFGEKKQLLSKFKGWNLKNF